MSFFIKDPSTCVHTKNTFLLQRGHLIFHPKITTPLFESFFLATSTSSSFSTVSILAKQWSQTALNPDGGFVGKPNSLEKIPPAFTFGIACLL